MYKKVRTPWFTVTISDADQKQSELRKKGYWVTADKRVVHVSDMTDSHLINTVHFLERRAYEYAKQKVPSPWTMPLPQGEMAQEAYYQACEQYDEWGAGFREEASRAWLDAMGIYRLMLDELDRRGLRVHG